MLEGCKELSAARTCEIALHASREKVPNRQPLARAKFGRASSSVKLPAKTTAALILTEIGSRLIAESESSARLLSEAYVLGGT